MLALRLSRARAAVNSAPTEAQKKAGNYAKGHVTIHGLRVSIENPRGSVRTGMTEEGRIWRQQMAHDYGYIKGSEGNDGDQVDCFIGDHPDSHLVYVIDQIDPETGRFDEHKCILGARNEREARAAYQANYPAGWKGIGAITALPVGEFREWLENHDTRAPMSGNRLPAHLVFTKAVRDSRKAVQHPGVRGGKGYYDPKGQWQYGERPIFRDARLRKLYDHNLKNLQLRVKQAEVLSRPVEQIPHAKEYYNRGIFIVTDDEGHEITVREGQVIFHPEIDVEKNQRSNGPIRDIAAKKAEFTADIEKQREWVAHQVEITEAYLERLKAKDAGTPAITSEGRILTKALPDDRKPVFHPGVRGGKYYVDKHGAIRYGVPLSRGDRGKSEGEKKSSPASMAVKPTSERAFDGNPRPVRTPMSKQAVGKLGESIVLSWLQGHGAPDAGHLNLDRNNFPIDLIFDHQLVEVKAGLVSNGQSAQHWRLTVGEPGPKEKAWLAKASAATKARHQERKQQMILERKQQVLKEAEQAIGRKFKTATLTLIIDPDRKIADVFRFEGWHQRIGWKSEQARAGYVGSVRYG
jgi:hypothetical protein